MMILTNREWALLAWVLVLIVAGFWMRTTREFALNILKLVFGHPIGTVLAVSAAYAFACAWLLSQMGLWKTDNLKTTVLWWLTFAVVEIFSANRIDEDAAYFRKAVREIFSATVLIAFIADSYTFSLPIELALVPLIVFISLLTGVASAKAEHQIVERLGTGILVLLGLTIFTKGVVEVIRNLRDFAILGTARDFVVPIILSAMFLPFLYSLNIWMVYERVFTGISFGIEDRALRRYAKRKAVLAFRTDVDFLKRWRRLVLSERPTSRDDLKRTFQEIHEVKQRELHPPAIGCEEGLAPHVARNLLATEGLATKDYHRIYEDRWTASSSPLKVGADFLSNTITYSIDGNARAVTQLSLDLNIFQADRDDVVEAELRFAALAEALARAATGKEIETQRGVLDGDSWTLSIDDFRLISTKEVWELGNRSGFERTFTIRHKAHHLAEWEHG